MIVSDSGDPQKPEKNVSGCVEGKSWKFSKKSIFLGNEALDQKSDWYKKDAFWGQQYSNGVVFGV